MSWSDPTVIIAAIYTIVTCLIWYATKQNTEATKNVLEAAHRPYVAATEAALIFPQTYGGIKTLRITVSNIGTVPAGE